MKLKTTLFVLLFFISIYTKAQNYVTIPDTNFVAWLNTHYPTCMNGNQMDITCSAIINAVNVGVCYSNIADLTGIEYFTNLQELNCSYNLITYIPILPNTLIHLECSQNLLTSLPTMPNSLQYLGCSGNLLTSLPALPDSLNYFHCDYNHLTNITFLPSFLVNFGCVGNQLTSLPVFPNSLAYLECEKNQLITLPTLSNLWYLNCGNNLLTSLPTLPNNLTELFCDNNHLTSLPAMPNSLLNLYCNDNQLTGLPDLPNTLQVLFCNDNNISCFPVFPNSIYGWWSGNNHFNISTNPFSCLPNYIDAMSGADLAYPLCEQGDTLNNPHGCLGADGLTGFTYKDNNANCLKNAGDNGLINIPLKLYDNNNNLLAQMCSHGIGGYKFVKLPGTYTVAIDTTAMPFRVQCLHPGIDSTVTITTANPLASNINFALACKPGVDVGVQSVVADGLIFPSLQFILKVFAGSMGQWYNLGCSAGVSGQVIVTVNGSVTYIGPAPGALTPSVSGNIYTYNIANFDNVVNAQDFALNFSTSTFSLIGDSICVDVSVTPTVGDINPGNNTYHSCFNVFNSLDPNMKEVYPVNVLPGYDGYFTYTIHFQNTGTAPAQNIRIVDTLSNNLDLETFKVINYSHNNVTSLNGNILTIRFPNIMLHDSINNDPESKGFIQYKIKPKGNLPDGTQIKNTAFIYFDYNAPVATNTTINEFMLNVLIKENAATFQMSIYPNPVQDNATLVFTTPKAQRLQIKGYDMLGQEVLLLNQSVNAGTNSIQINTSALAKGFYMLSVRDESNDTRTLKFIK